MTSSILLILLGVVIVHPLQLVQALAILSPRNATNATTNDTVHNGMSHVVETSIIVVLLIAILFLVSLHLFRKWSFFGQHIKWMFCCNSSSTTVMNGDRHRRVDIPVARLDRVVTGVPPSTHTSSMTHPPLQRPPKVLPSMATRHDAYTIRGGIGRWQ